MFIILLVAQDLNYITLLLAMLHQQLGIERQPVYFSLIYLSFLKIPPTRRDVRSQYLSRVIGASPSPVAKSEIMAKTPERSEPQTAAAEPAKASTELEFELDSEMKLDEEEGWVDEHEIEMKAGVRATNGRKDM